jgi:catechol 2,3-dioxygenase-like lactoylglutathione lyase family enzyme
VTPVLADIRTRRPSAALGLIDSYSHLVLEVGEVARTIDFYTGLLGFKCTSSSRIEIGGNQYLELVQQEQPKTLPETGTHQAYRFAAVDSVVARLKAASIEVHDYHEDRPAERDQNRYCYDPDGNRVQLLSGQPGIDHAAIETHDLEWAETFYTQVLGGIVESRVGWRMEDYAGATQWEKGDDHCAPGTRRWDTRYTTVESKAKVARPNAQIFLHFGGDAILGIYLATEHRQEPPPDQYSGTPRIGLRAASGRLTEIEQRLRDVRLRSMQLNPETGGPYQRQGSSLLVRDPGGNFLAIVE